MKRVLLTGASGFLGRHCLDRLVLEGCDVHAVNRTGSGKPAAGVTWHAADLRETAEVAALIAKIRPTHVLHGAWIATPGLYSHSPENLTWLQSTIALAQAFGAQRGARFVGIGSSAEYAPDDRPCLEDETPVRPATIYGKCKAAAWLAVRAVAQQHGFSAAWGRVFLPYGPGDSPQRLVPSVLGALRAGKSVPTTDGRQQRDFIYAPDAADLLIRLLLSQEDGAFNIGTGRATTIRSVVEYLATRCGRPDLPQFGARALAPGEPAALVADMSKVRAKLSWAPQTELRDGLEHVLASIAAAD